MTANRCSYRPCQIPFLLDSTVYNIPRYVIDFRPFGDVFCYTINFDISVLSVIVVLLFASCPSAIVWLVISAIVDSIDGIFRSWPWAHIGKEVYKSLGTKPLTTNDNSAPPVISITRMIGVCAPFNHAAPSLVFDGPSFAMLFLRGAYAFVTETSARLSNTIKQVGIANFFFCSAITLTQVKTGFSNCSTEFNNDKSIKFLTYNIFSSFDHIVFPFITILYHKTIDMQGLYYSGMDN